MEARLPGHSRGARVGDRIGHFEACSTSTGYYGLSARRVAKRPVCLEGSDGFVCSTRRFDSYRLERTRCRVGLAPTDDQHLPFAAHAMRVLALALQARNASSRFMAGIFSHMRSAVASIAARFLVANILPARCKFR